MTLLRSLFVLMALALAPALAPLAAHAEELLPMPAKGVDGMWIEDWMRPSTGDLTKDRALAAAEGKVLAIFWERDGCEFCAQLHGYALRMPALHRYVAERFYAVRLDFYGQKKFIDLDGAERTEQDMKLRHKVVGTPAIEFHTADGVEVLRIPGYVEPPVLKAAFEFVDTGAYKTTNINAFLHTRPLQ